ncbi:Uma2 family endonuclease [Nocardia sp. XZ_19_385]|uniref:Uma2 family endonuclease n=1 Tax=Nocardia sp. XZ_19_385 TaxID=2769488 RepID=UPI00188F6C43|nr:Uma2 family endonuclease [Nocardia sp. XZ_19_385]
MTIRPDRPQMSETDFEALAEHAPAAVRLEFESGKLGVQTAGGGPQLLIEEFEELARHAPGAVALEFLDGVLGAKVAPDRSCVEIRRSITQQILRQREELRLYPALDLKVQADREGRVRADGALALDGSFRRRGGWAEPDEVLMVLEITAHESATDQRARTRKTQAYAEAEIPLYLLVDRAVRGVFVFSHPLKGWYAQTSRTEFGHTMELPDPVGVVLETEPFGVPAAASGP